MSLNREGEWNRDCGVHLNRFPVLDQRLEGPFLYALKRGPLKHWGTTDHTRRCDTAVRSDSDLQDNGPGHPRGLSDRRVNRFRVLDQQLSRVVLRDGNYLWRGPGVLRRRDFTSIFGLEQFHEIDVRLEQEL